MIIPNDFYSLSFNLFAGASTRAAVTTHGVLDENVVGPAAVADLVGDLFNTYVLEWLSTSCLLLSVEVRDNGGVVYTQTRSDSGSISGDIYSPNCAVLVQKRSSESGRRNRGRMFLPFFAESSCDSLGFLSSGMLSGFQTALDNYLEGLADADVPMVIFHNDSPGTPTAVNTLVLNPRVGQQSRRLKPV